MLAQSKRHSHVLREQTEPFHRCSASGDDDSQHSWSSGSVFLFLSGAASLSMFGFPPPAQAKKDSDIENYVDRIMVTAGPILQTLGFSGFIGLCVGKALKAVSGCIAVAVGLTFISVQLWAHQTGSNLDYSSWEEKGWFEKDAASDAMKKGLRMLTQVCCSKFAASVND